jgi:hypothetical protein
MNQAARFGRVVAGGLCLCGILLAAGCGGGKGVVSGKVFYQGQPVRGGNVSFVSEGGGAMSSPIEEDGSYTIRNVPPGTVTITVETDSFRQGGPGGGPPPELLKNMKKPMPEKDAQAEHPGNEAALREKDRIARVTADRAKRYVQIPPQYSDFRKSNLTYVVKSGQQEHDIDLK